MKILNQNLASEIIELAQQGLPNEVCGYLAGKGDYILRIYPLKNTDQSPEHFSMDPQEQFEVMRRTHKEGLGILGVYHSHPQSPARPSKEDILLASDPEISYIIISLLPSVPEIKSFHIEDGRVETEEIKFTS